MSECLLGYSKRVGTHTVYNVFKESLIYFSNK